MPSRHTQDSKADHYAALHQGFGWVVPEHFNIAQACCGRWASDAQGAQRPEGGLRVDCDVSWGYRH